MLEERKKSTGERVIDFWLWLLVANSGVAFFFHIAACIKYLFY